MSRREEEKKKRKFEASSAPIQIPENNLHIRNSHHSVRTEFYNTVDTLISKYHCSLTHAVAGVIETGKEMLGLDWKYFDENPDSIDLDTAPHKKTHSVIGKAKEAFAISEIVKAIMESEDTSSITYHDHG